MNAYLAGKMTTQRMKGGNTDSVYTDGDQRKTFAESLQKQHPKIVDVVWKFKRWHHQVDYKGFTQELQPKESFVKRDYQLELDTNEEDPIRYETLQYRKGRNLINQKNISYTTIKVRYDPLSCFQGGIDKINTEIPFDKENTQVSRFLHDSGLHSFEKQKEKKEKKVSKKGFFVTPTGLIKTEVLFYWSKNIPRMKLSEQLIHHALKYDRLALFVQDDVLYIWNLSRSENFYNTKTFSTVEWIQNREKN
jgi:hypothetical protein